jgi:hypothetical protein
MMISPYGLAEHWKADWMIPPRLIVWVPAGVAASL